MFYLTEKYNEHFPVGVADVLGYALPWPSLRKVLKHETLRTASTIDKYVHHPSLVILSDVCESGISLVDSKMRVLELISALMVPGVCHCFFQGVVGRTSVFPSSKVENVDLFPNRHRCMSGDHQWEHSN